MAHCSATIYQQVTLSGDDEWPKVADAMIEAFFRVLEQQGVPLEDLDIKLREIAANYKMLLERVRTLSTDDPLAAQFRETVATAVQEGDFDRAEQLLTEAQAQDIASAQELQDIVSKRLLTAAKARVELAHLYEIQEHFEKAEDAYKTAISLLERISDNRVPALAQTLKEYASLLRKLQRHEEADQLALQAKSI